MANDIGLHRMKTSIKMSTDEQLIKNIKDLLTTGFEPDGLWSEQGITNHEYYDELVYEAAERGIDHESTKPTV